MLAGKTDRVDDCIRVVESIHPAVVPRVENMRLRAALNPTYHVYTKERLKRFRCVSHSNDQASLQNPPFIQEWLDEQHSHLNGTLLKPKGIICK